MTGAEILLDEHVGRVFERLLQERGHRVTQAKDRFGEHTSDPDLLSWCDENDTVLLTNNAKDFEPLHHEHDHAGLLLYYDQTLPDTDPEGLARAVDEVFTQYGLDGVENRRARYRESFQHSGTHRRERMGCLYDRRMNGVT